MARDPRRPGRPRWTRIVVGALAVAVSLAVLAAGGYVVVRYAWLPGWRPALEPGERYALDVSHHQGPIDWQAVADDGIELTYLKATEGGSFVDRRFEENWRGAAAAGIEWGAYHFFTLCRSGREQAEHVVATVPLAAADLPLAVDLEFSVFCDERPSPERVRADLADFLETVEQASGRPSVLYVLPDFDARYGVTDAFDRELWVRSMILRPGDEEPGGGEWWLWQASARASVAGIGEPVDLNVLRAGG